MFDFTIKIYKTLLSATINQGYGFQTFTGFLRSPGKKVILLRHDVDARKENSLRFAEILHKMGIHGSFYFRVVPQSFDQQVIRVIAEMGHEIGYHYETMDTCQGDVNKAYDEFCINLETFRKIVPVNTICMHGSPRSKFDNKSIWKKYDYRELGIIGEPYFDLDFSEVLYITDTGRRWDGNKVSVRDKVEIPDHFKHLVFNTTEDIINAVEKNILPGKIMFTFHPQRWTDNPVAWINEFIGQNSKNIIKKYFFVDRPF